MAAHLPALDTRVAPRDINNTAVRTDAGDSGRRLDDDAPHHLPQLGDWGQCIREALPWSEPSAVAKPTTSANPLRHKRGRRPLAGH